MNTQPPTMPPKNRPPRTVPGTDDQLNRARTHAEALLLDLRLLAASAAGAQQEAWRHHLDAVSEALRFAEANHRPGQRTEQPPSYQLVFGRLLRDRRDAEGLTRAELARQAKLSDTLIKQIEYGKEAATRRTLLRLMEVDALRLTWADVPTEMGGTAEVSPVSGDLMTVTDDAASDLNCYIPPLFDPVGMILEFARTLNGDGGHVEQTTAYLDHASAAAYMRMCRQGRWYAATYRDHVPIGLVAERIVQATQGRPLHVIALGAGEATLESRLVKHIADSLDDHDIRFCLFDISQPMLNIALQFAINTFDGFPDVMPYGVQGDFHRLTAYPQAYSLPPGSRRRRVYTLLGCTLANIENEIRFFQDSLIDAACAPDDLFVFDVQVAAGSADDPDEIRAKEHALSQPFQPMHAEWLSGPFRRYCRDVQDVQFHMRLDTRCPVPGSYALDAIATVSSHKRPDRQFSMLRFRRYDPIQLIKCIESIGWRLLLHHPYGIGGERTAAVLLFQKLRTSHT